MCHYIYIVLPAEADLTAVKKLVRQHNRVLEPATPHCRTAVGNGDQVYFTNRGCDCGTMLGALASKSGPELRITPAKIRKLPRKGWSEAKIARWLQSLEEDKEKRERERDTLERSSHGNGELVQWTGLIRAVLEAHATRELGILLVWEGGRASAQFSGEQAVDLAQLSEDLLLQMAEGIIYRFSTASASRETD